MKEFPDTTRNLKISVIGEEFIQKNVSSNITTWSEERILKQGNKRSRDETESKRRSETIERIKESKREKGG